MKPRAPALTIPVSAPQLDIGISDDHRRRIADGVGGLLADSYVL